MTAKQAKFQFEHMLLMLSVGRVDDANIARKKVYEYLVEEAKTEVE